MADLLFAYFESFDLQMDFNLSIFKNSLVGVGAGHT